MTTRKHRVFHSIVVLFIFAAAAAAGRGAQLSLNPVIGLQDQDLTIVLTGQSTHWVNGKTVATFGPGVSAGTVTVDSATQAAVPIQIAGGAALGPRTITITTGTETVTASFKIEEAIPSVQLINPNYGVPGRPVTVNITGVATDFKNGTAVSLGPNVAIYSITVNGPTSLTVTGQVAAGAPLAAADVTVQSGTQMLRVPLGFTITANTGSGPTGNLVGNLANVPLNAHLVIQYNTPVKRSTVNTTNITMNYSNVIGQPVPLTVTLDASGRQVTLLPKVVLEAGSSLYVTANGITDAFGNAAVLGFAGFTTGYTVDETTPVLNVTSPAGGETGVPNNSSIAAQFSKSMDPASVISALVVSGPGGVIPGTITPDSLIQTFRMQPATLLLPNTTYTVSFSSPVMDVSGNILTNPGSWTFTTDGGPDYTFFYPVAVDPPVTSSPPVNVVLRVQYPVAVDATTIMTFGTPSAVTTQLSADRRIIAFFPTTPLAPGTPYSFSVSACSETSSCSTAFLYFTTGSTTDFVPPAVTSISPGNGSSGLPVNAQVAVTMSEELDPTSVSAAAIQLTPLAAGTVSLDPSFQVLAFTPSSLLMPATNYTVTVSGLRDIAGNTMAPFSSSFRTSKSPVPVTTSPNLVSVIPGNGGTGVPVMSKIVMNFDAPIDPEYLTSNYFSVSVSGPTFFGNIAGTLVLTKPNQLTFTPAAPYPATSFVTASGRVFGLTGLGAYVFVSFTTADTPNLNGPTVTSISPPNGATGVGPGTMVIINFSESVNPQTTFGPNVAVFAGESSLYVPITFSPDNRTMTIPLSYLPPSTVITVVLTAGVQDFSGNPLTPFQSSFTTAPAGTNPQIYSQIPANGATGVAVNSPISLFTSAPMNGSTLNSAIFVTQNGIVVPAAISLPDPQSILIEPQTPFTPGALVSITVTSAATSATGLPVFQYNGGFRVEPNLKNSVASVVNFSPGNNTAPLNAVVDLEFDKALNPATVNSASIQLLQYGYIPVPANISMLNGNTTIRLMPTAILAPSTDYSVLSPGGIVDSDGIPVAPINNLNFFTGNSPAGSPPVVVEIVPPGGYKGIATNAKLYVSFSSAVDPVTISGSTIRLTDPSGTIKPSSIFIDQTGANVTIVPNVVLSAGTRMKVTVNGVQDLAGQSVLPQSATFVTGNGPDTVTPSVVGTSIPNFATGVPVNSVFNILFNEPVSPDSINPASFMKDQFGQPVPGALTFVNGNMQVRFSPSAVLAPNSTYSLSILNFMDLSGNSGGGLSLSFTTSASADTTPPQILASNPPLGASQVPTNVQLQVLFDEPVSLVNTSRITLTAGSTTVPVTVPLNQNLGSAIVSIVPAGLLSQNTSYTLTVSLPDVAGNWMKPVAIPFTTAASPDLSYPLIVSQNPAPFSVNVPVTVDPSITLDVPFSPVSVGGLTLVQNYCGSPSVPASVALSPDFQTLTLTPSAPLAPNTVYWLCGDASDIVGNLVYTYYSFTTAP
jgi:hypothetical protein